MTTPLTDYLLVQSVWDKEMKRLLQEATAEAEAIVKSYGRKTGFEKTKALQAVRDLRKVTSEVYGEGSVLIQRGQGAAAKAASVSERWMQGVLESRYGAPMPHWDKALGYSAQNGIQAVLARRKNAIPLAQSVYRGEALANGKVADVVNRGLLLQKSADMIAKDVSSLINPNVPGGVSYAANRLARTEINNAFHAQQVASREEEPWTVALQWHLSGSHPKPDECNQYAEEEHEKGLGKGVFKKGTVPNKPHPNCLCYITTVTVDEDDFIDGFLAGQYDAHIDKKIYGSGIEVPC